MEQVSRMAAEVNKLIGSTLLAGNAVHFPEVGSLYIVVNQEGTKNVDFSSAEQGSPLIEIIKDRAGCTPEQAAQIYDKWISEVRTPSTLTIVGVGELRTKSFITTDSFLQQLNNKPTTEENQTVMENQPTPAPVDTPVEVPTQKPATPAQPAPAPANQEPKKGGNKTLIIILVVAAVLVGGYFAYNSVSKAKAEKARIEAIAKEKAIEQQRIADSIALAQIKAQRRAQAEADAVVVAPRYRVVYGVYELRSNVDVAIKHINGQFGADRGQEYPYGALTMVTMFESDSRNECQQFLMEYYELYPDTWIHDSEQ
ncbi:MAG: hypothetical protein SNH94_01355 [Rikenellaceae bacterium]